MTVVESVLAGIERLVLPKLASIEARLTVLENEVKSLRGVELKSIRELMEVKFKALEEKLDLERRLSVVEERQQKTSN
jgi:hypothetical protein